MKRIGRSHLRLLIVALATFVVLSTGVDVLGQGIIEPSLPASPLLPEQRPIVIALHQIDAVIDGPVAKVSVTQVFRNNGGRVVEGVYVFPLPLDAAIGDFQMTVDGQVMEGTLYTVEEARAIYESIVRRRRDPALLEYVGQGLFQTSVFPIPPGEERTLKLTYTQVLPREGKLTRFEVPLRTGHLSPAPVESLSLNVDIRNYPGLRTIYGVNHAVDVDRTGDASAMITYEARDVQSTQDFGLYFGSAGQPIDAQLLSYKPAAEDGYFMLLVTPEIDVRPAEVIERDIVLILDVSGSMEGEKIEQAKMAAHYVVNHLNPGDRFNLLTFNTQPTGWQSQPTAIDAAAADEVHGWIDSMRADGSTDINAALLEALAQLDGQSTRPAYLLFLTDGLPTQGVADTGPIIQNALVNRPAERAVRLFTFGVGYDVNTELLDTLSQELGGRSTYVLPDERIDEAISQFYSGVDTPVLANITLEFDEEDDAALAVEEIYPSPLPDLFAGDQLVVTGRYRTASDESLSFTLHLRGDVNGKSRAFDYPGQSLVSSSGQPFVGRLWATRKIGAMLQAVRRNGPDAELVDAIIDLSLKYGITTPYTSYLVVEPTAARASASIRLDRSSSPASSSSLAVPSVRSQFSLSADSAYMRDAPVSGERAVIASMERSKMQQASRVRDPDLMRYVSGKVFVPQPMDGGANRDMTLWVDSEYEEEMKLEVVEFGTARYFELASKRQNAEWLSVSSELILVLDDDHALRVTADRALVNDAPTDDDWNEDATTDGSPAENRGEREEGKGPWRRWTDWLRNGR